MYRNNLAYSNIQKIFSFKKAATKKVSLDIHLKKITKHSYCDYKKSFIFLKFLEFIASSTYIQGRFETLKFEHCKNIETHILEFS